MPQPRTASARFRLLDSACCHLRVTRFLVTMQVFDIASRKVVRCFEDPSGGSISAAAFSPDGAAIASGCADASIKVRVAHARAWEERRALV